MRRTILLFSLTCLLAACGKSAITLTSYDGKQSATVQVEVADSVNERTQGLMTRTSLPEDAGMLFVFPAPIGLQFWMKDTLIPLEIFFFDEQGGFINVVTMQPCKTDPCPQYKSAALSQYALEVNPGFRERHRIGTGWRLDTAEVTKISKPE